MATRDDRSNRGERCDRCLFWDDLDVAESTDDVSIPATYDDVGICERHAPRPLVVIGALESGPNWEYAVRPLTGRIHWCGEFQRADEGAIREVDSEGLL